MYSSIGGTFYTVGKEKFYCYFMRENQIQVVLRQEGFSDPDMKTISVDPNEFCEDEKMYFVSAKVKNVH